MSKKKDQIIERLKVHCTEQSFERGKTYYEDGWVKNIEQYGDRVIARVMGTRTYQVTLDLIEGDIAVHCNCPYEYDGYCKHIVATVLLWSKNRKKIKRSMEKERKALDRIFKRATKEEMKEYLMKKFKKNTVLKRNFMKYFSEEPVGRKKVKH